MRLAVWRTASWAGVGGVVEEEVVLDAHVGDDGHGDLDVAALDRRRGGGRRRRGRGRGAVPAVRWWRVRGVEGLGRRRDLRLRCGSAG